MNFHENKTAPEILSGAGIEESFGVRCPRCGGERFMIKSREKAVCLGCRRALEFSGGLSDWNDAYLNGAAGRGVTLCAGIEHFGRRGEMLVTVAAGLPTGALELGQCADLRAGERGVYSLFYDPPRDDGAPPESAEPPAPPADSRAKYAESVFGGESFGALSCPVCGNNRFILGSGTARCFYCALPQNVKAPPSGHCEECGSSELYLYRSGKRLAGVCVNRHAFGLDTAN